MERAFGLNVPRTLEEVCRPRRMALLVYDMQVGIVNQLPHGPDITAKVTEVLRAAREGGFPVFFSRHMSLPKELMGLFQMRQAMAWQRVDRAEDVEPWFPRDSPQFHIVPELEPLPSEAISDKIAMSAFSGTFLDMALRDLGIVSFAIVGIATEIGIEPTVRHGADLGYVPVLVADACGAGSEEAARHSLELLHHAGDALITDADTISVLLRKAAHSQRRTHRTIKEYAMGDARLNDVGIVVREILAARGIELTGERSFAEEFRSQGFEEAVGRQASKQNMQNWFFAAGEWRHVPTGFGPWFAEAYDLTDKEIADLCYVCIMRRLPAGYSDPYA